jgi:hypothetical protein
VEESIRQREHLIKELELKFNLETEKLKELHDKELEQLEQQLEKGNLCVGKTMQCDLYTFDGDTALAH